jgi:predicted transcriptional regulator
MKPEAHAIAMSLTITVPDEIARAAEELATASGESPEALLIRALQAHFPPLPRELQDEFDAWERASDEDMARLEEREGLAAP